MEVSGTYRMPYALPVWMGVPPAEALAFAGMRVCAYGRLSKEL